MRRFGGGLKLTALVVVILIITVALMWIAFSAAAGRDLEAKIQEVRAAGYALDLVEFAAHEIPDSKNAALIYQEAFGLVVDPSDEEGKFLDPSVLDLEAGLSEEDRKILKAFLEKNQDAFEMLEEAAAFDLCRFPIAYEDGMSALLPHIAECIKASKMLSIRARFQVLEGRPGQAAKSLQASMALGESL